MNPDTNEIRKRVGHRIKVRRVDLSLSQSQLGERVGVTQAQISEWEIGRRGMRVDQLIQLAEALETTVGNLIGEEKRTLANT
jgi:transcriptional regulator with XRE-family HTH domain